MNKIEELIQQLCPEGVVYKQLADIAQVAGAGVDKKIHENERGITLLNFLDVYKNQYIDSNTPTMRVTANEKKIEQCNVLKGDIFITPSSEVKNEIGFSAMAVEDMPGVVYSYHIMRIRLYKFNLTQSMFINYLFRSDALQEQINKQAKGLTRFGLTKSQWEKIQIPIPPLPVQQEIVNILDTFTQLEAELEAELEARKKQYEYYRNELLTFGDEVEWKTIKAICKNVTSGGTPSTSKPEYYNGSIPWLRTQEVDWIDIYNTSVKITEDGLKYSSAKLIPINCVIVAMYGATAAKVGINKIPLTTNQACCNLEIDDTQANYRYVFHWLCKEYKNLKSLGEGSQSNINGKKIKQYPIPIPPLAEQELIVGILDKFDALVNDITIGLPAEIEARRKQYEYYREKLLSFDRAE